MKRATQRLSLPNPLSKGMEAVPSSGRSAGGTGGYSATLHQQQQRINKTAAGRQSMDRSSANQLASPHNERRGSRIVAQPGSATGAALTPTPGIRGAGEGSRGQARERWRTGYSKPQLSSSPAGSPAKCTATAVAGTAGHDPLSAGSTPTIKSPLAHRAAAAASEALSPRQHSPRSPATPTSRQHSPRSLATPTAHQHSPREAAAPTLCQHPPQEGNLPSPRQQSPREGNPPSARQQSTREGNPPIPRPVCGPEPKALSPRCSTATSPSILRPQASTLSPQDQSGSARKTLSPRDTRSQGHAQAASLAASQPKALFKAHGNAQEAAAEMAVAVVDTGGRATRPVGAWPAAVIRSSPAAGPAAAASPSALAHDPLNFLLSPEAAIGASAGTRAAARERLSGAGEQLTRPSGGALFSCHNQLFDDDAAHHAEASPQGATTAVPPAHRGAVGGAGPGCPPATQGMAQPLPDRHRPESTQAPVDCVAVVFAHQQHQPQHPQHPQQLQQQARRRETLPSEGGREISARGLAPAGLFPEAYRNAAGDEETNAPSGGGSGSSTGGALSVPSAGGSEEVGQPLAAGHGGGDKGFLGKDSLGTVDSEGLLLHLHHLHGYDLAGDPEQPCKQRAQTIGGLMVGRELSHVAVLGAVQAELQTARQLLREAQEEVEALRQARRELEEAHAEDMGAAHRQLHACMQELASAERCRIFAESRASVAEGQVRVLEEVARAAGEQLHAVRSLLCEESARIAEAGSARDRAAERADEPLGGSEEGGLVHVGGEGKRVTHEPGSAWEDDGGDYGVTLPCPPVQFSSAGLCASPTLSSSGIPCASAGSASTAAPPTGTAPAPGRVSTLGPAPQPLAQLQTHSSATSLPTQHSLTLLLPASMTATAALEGLSLESAAAAGTGQAQLKPAAAAPADERRVDAVDAMPALAAGAKGDSAGFHPSGTGVEELMCGGGGVQSDNTLGRGRLAGPPAASPRGSKEAPPMWLCCVLGSRFRVA